MTKHQALRIKVLRIRWDYTWRAIALEWFERYNVYDISHQQFGRNLCYEAMTLLNEKVEDGWN